MNPTKTHTDLLKLKEQVNELVYNERYVIQWQHMRSRHHSNVTENEITQGLLRGSYKPDDRGIDGRYHSWSRLTYPPRLIHIVFEVQKADAGSFVRIITAFDED